MSRAILVPQDPGRPLAEVDLDLDDLRALLRQTVGDDAYLEQVRTQALYDLGFSEGLPRGQMVVMLVDDSGVIRGLPLNARASLFYPGGFIAGDAWLVLSERDPLEGDVWVGLPEDWLTIVERYIIDAALSG